jgi:hypothetical protein
MAVVFEPPRVFGAIFRTSAVKCVQPGNNIPFTVIGKVKYNGQLHDFGGSDTVRVLDIQLKTKCDTEDITSLSENSFFENPTIKNNTFFNEGQTAVLISPL